MKKQNGNALAKNEPSGLVVMPDYLKPAPGAPRRGNENVTPEDVIVPRLALCQSNSFERKKGHAKFIEGLEEGSWFNTATKQIYGEQLDVINVHYFRSRIRWNGTIGEGMLCRSDDGATGVGEPGGDCSRCEFAKFKQDEEDARPSCSLFMNFPCLVIDGHGNVDPAGIVIASFKSIAIGTGKLWNSLVNIRNNDRFKGVYRLTAVEDHRASGDSWQPHVENSPINKGWITEAQLQAAETSYELINSWRAAGRMPAPESETVAV